MNSIKYYKLLLLILLVAFTFVACTKDNEEPEPVPSKTDNISGKTIRYTVLVVPGGATSFKSTKGIDSAIVSLVMNDSIYNTPTDTNGLATFNNLAAGIAAVTVRYNNHTTANLIVNLAAEKDTGYDSNNLRNAATMVVLFPLSGSNTATISGKTFASLDTITPEPENAPAGLLVTTYLEPDQLIGYVNHTGDGEILSIAYENTTNHIATDVNSEYSIVVPATGSGLKVIVTCDGFQYNQVVTGGTRHRTYSAIADTIEVISGVSYFSDIQFEDK